jgi:hypothetical protein
MARVMPIYQGIERLQKAGDYIQWGGPHLFKGGNFRGMLEERALFSVLEPPDHMTGKDSLGLNRRRGCDSETNRETVPIEK